ncbi:MAG: desulfoferrodoxin FeS4 iron-binding domain-containing protein [Thermoguttaceae bacterium]|nr:desulfoferrodoxin FeS4 iron-binding domain-containing protein [Thermoguttaceae bacterium]
MKETEIYTCEICGKMVEVLRDGSGELVCCGQAMTLEKAQVDDANAAEKHVPSAKRDGKRVEVVIGAVEHPSEPEHYIEWIETTQGNRSKRVALQPGDRPIAEFCVEDGPALVRTYCNIHGLWKKEV